MQRTGEGNRELMKWGFVAQKERQKMGNKMDPNLGAGYFIFLPPHHSSLLHFPKSSQADLFPQIRFFPIIILLQNSHPTYSVLFSHAVFM